MIAIENISKKYNNKFLFQNLSFTFLNGKTLILGPNGAGKTTLLSMIFGLKRQNRGKIKCFGLDSINDFKKIKEIVSYLPSEGQFPSSLKFRDAIEFSLSYTTENVVSFYIEKLKIEHLLGKELHHMSSGEKRLCSIVFTLSSSKVTLLMDEPLINLDRERQSIITDIIKNENRNFIVTSHQDDFVFSGNFHLVKLIKSEKTQVSELTSIDKVNKIIKMIVTDQTEVSRILKNDGIAFSIKNEEFTVFTEPNSNIMDEIMKYVISFRRSVDY